MFGVPVAGALEGGDLDVDALLDPVADAPEVEALEDTAEALEANGDGFTVTLVGADWDSLFLMIA